MMTDLDASVENVLTMRRTGFTLLEVTLVCAVVAVLLAIAVPRFAHLRDASAVRAATGDLGATFALARQEAIARRTPVALVFDTAAGRVEVRAAGGRLLQRELAAAYGISLHANRDSVVYDPRGIGFGLANVTVAVRRGVILDTLIMSRMGRVRW